MLIDMVSEAAKELNTRERREWFESFVLALCRKVSLLQGMQEHTEDQFRTSKGIVFEVYLGNLNICLPSFACKDSSFDRRVEF